jgi:TusA-related sulfurtransferase
LSRPPRASSAGGTGSSPDTARARRAQVHGSASAAELEALQPDVEVDALGTFCPEPVIATQNRMKEMGAGEVLVLLADDAGVAVDIPAWCMSTGNEFLGMQKEPRRYRVFVRKQ